MTFNRLYTQQRSSKTGVRASINGKALFNIILPSDLSKVGERVAIFEGSGDDMGKLRIVRTTDTVGTSLIKAYNKSKLSDAAACGWVTFGNRSSPKWLYRGGSVHLTEIEYTVIDDDTIELTFPAQFIAKQDGVDAATHAPVFSTTKSVEGPAAQPDFTAAPYGSE